MRINLNSLESPDDSLKKRCSDAIFDLALVSCAGDEELVLYVYVVLGLGNCRDHGSLDASLDVVDACAPLRGTAENLENNKGQSPSA